MNILEVKKRVHKINEELFAKKYTIEMIEKFWSDCIKKSKSPNQLTIDI